MGVQSSKAFSATDVVNDCITNVAMSNAATCSSSNALGQDLNIRDITIIGDCPLNISGITQSAKLNSNFSCLQDSNASASLRNQLATQLDQKLKASLEGLNLNLASSAEVEAYTKIRNNIVTNVDFKNLSSCVSSNIAEQKMGIGGFKMQCSSSGKGININDIRQEIAVTSIAQCTQKNSSLMDSINNLQTLVQNKLDAENSGISTAALLAGLFVIILIVVAVICVSMGLNPLTWVYSIFNWFAGLFSSDEDEVKK